LVIIFGELGTTMVNSCITCMSRIINHLS